MTRKHTSMDAFESMDVFNVLVCKRIQSWNALLKSAADQKSSNHQHFSHCSTGNHSACRRWLKPSRYLWMWRMAVAVAWPLSSAKTWCVLFFLDAVSIQIQTYSIVLCSRHSLETDLEKEEQREIHPFCGNPKLGNSPAGSRMRCTFLTCPNQSF